MRIDSLKTKKNTLILGPKILTPNLINDDRGYFFESWNKKIFDDFLKSEINFKQENISLSKKGVLRGLHFQIKPFPQGKLISCLSGSIYDVVVDIRKDSNTFAKWGSVILTPKNEKLFWIPEGFAHGFLALEDNTRIQYKVTDYWEKNYERSINWSDKFINIDWNFKYFGISSPILSKKDEDAPYLSEFNDKEDFI